MRKRQVSHEETTIEMLRRDPALADEYLRVSMEEIAEPGGEGAFLSALRQVALARCSSLAEVAAAAGMKREAVSRALSPKANPTLKTLTALCRATGVQLVARIAPRRKAQPATRPSAAKRLSKGR